MIEARRQQLHFGEGLIAEEVSDLREEWMTHADQVLEDEQLISTVYEALAKRSPRSRTRGRRGTPAEVVMRLLLLKHIRNWSFDILEREVRANLVYRDFTRVGASKAPDSKTMGRWELALGPETVEKIHERVVEIAKENQVVPGRKMRLDTTVVETNIHYPTDSSLLGDGVRVLIRAMKRITDIAGQQGAKLRDRSRSVKFRILEIGRVARTKGGPNRERLQQGYEKLLSTVGRVVGQAKRFSGEVAQGVKRSADVMQQAALDGLRKELDTFVPRVQQVIRQAKQRIFGGNTHVAEKLVSIFEPTTEIIRKGKASKPTEFGKMVKIQEGENQIITDYAVYEKRPSDSELVIPALEAHEKKLGCTPRPGGRRCGILLSQERIRRARERRQTRVHPESLHQKRRAEARAKEALVQARPEMADRLRGPHQRVEATTRPSTMHLPRRCRHEAVGRTWRDRRQSPPPRKGVSGT